MGYDWNGNSIEHKMSSKVFGIKNVELGENFVMEMGGDRIGMKMS